MTTPPQDGTGGTYKNDFKPNNTFLNNIFLIKITRSVGASSGAVPQSGHDIMLGKAAFRTQSAW